MSSELLCRTAPFNKSTLHEFGFDPADITCVDLSGGEVYDLVAAFIAKHAKSTRRESTFTFDISRSKDGGDDGDEGHRVAVPALGLGLFEFDFQPLAECSCASSDSSSISMVEAECPAPTTLYALHQTLGNVVGTDCGPKLYKSLVLLAPGKASLPVIQSFVNHLLAQADQTEEHKFTCYRWHVQYQYWRHEETAVARPIQSVVLPAAIKDKLLDDLDDFVARGTARWYREHGIPYKRSYLLFGVPGAGKTSLIQAIAGRYKRNLAILQPSHPEMTDDSLKAAVQRVPHRSIIVLEDVDALFEAGRTKSSGNKSSLTFSGVLNALDGVGGCAGQIFVLTTNHRERLDPALIRNGRVDLHIEFTHAGYEQMKGLFLSFYREASEQLADAFAKGLTELLGERKVSAAQLQHYFIMMRKESAETASAGFGKVLEEAEAHGQLGAEKEKAGEKAGDDPDGKGKAKAKGKKNGGKQANKEEGDEAANDVDGDGGSEEDGDQQKPRGGSKAQHVHVHIH